MASSERAVDRELSEERWRQATAEVTHRRVRFWRAPDLEMLAALIEDANRYIRLANRQMLTEHQIEPFEPDDIRHRWSLLHE